MHGSIVKVTAKGQISIPKKMQDAMGVNKGDDLVLVLDGDKLVIKKFAEEDFRDLLHLSDSVAQSIWGSSEDDVWDTV